MGFVSFLSISENGFCRVKIREIFPTSCLQRALTCFASTFADVSFAQECFPTYFSNTGFLQMQSMIWEDF